MPNLYPLAVHAFAGLATTIYAFLYVPNASSPFIHLGYSLLFGLIWPLFWLWRLLSAVTSL